MPKKKSGWFRPYALTRRNIAKVVAGKGPGVYALGFLEDGSKLKVKKIASGWDVESELEQSIGQFSAFAYKPFNHQLEAFKTLQPSLF